MQRSITTALILFALVAPATAGELTDTDRRFRLTAPDGWTNEATPGQPIALVIASPRIAETRGNCNVVVMPNEFGGRSQNEVDEIANEAINNEAFWKSVLATVPSIKSSTVDTFGKRDQDGRKVYFAKTTSSVEVGGLSLSLKQVQDIHATPGTTFGVTCTAQTEKYERETADIETIRLSFKPSLGLMVSWNSAPIYPVAVRGGIARFARDGRTAGVMHARGRR